MSALAIYIIALTVATAIWLAFAIAQDVIRANKTERPDVETFDVSGMVDQETPVTVEETEDGFAISKPAPAPAPAPSPEQPKTVPAPSDVKPTVVQVQPDKPKADPAKEAAEQMQTLGVAAVQDEFSDEEFAELFNNEEKSRKSGIVREVLVDPKDVADDAERDKL